MSCGLQKHYKNIRIIVETATWIFSLTSILHNQLVYKEVLLLLLPLVTMRG